MEWVDPSIVFDLGKSGKKTNIKRDKDQMIGDAVLEEWKSEVGTAEEHEP